LKDDSASHKGRKDEERDEEKEDAEEEEEESEEENREVRGARGGSKEPDIWTAGKRLRQNSRPD
jgi:hypothetical protein